MTDDLRALDEDIARLRGWTLIADGSGRWMPVTSSASREDYAMGDGSRGFPGPPPFSREWALTGLLLDDLLDAADAPMDGAGMGDLLAQAVAGPEGRLRVIASTWLVWKRGRP